MKIFSNDKTTAQINDFAKLISDAEAKLQPLAENADINMIKDFIKNFNLKTNDLFNENRKLNIGVVGQVKAGKSSFLNALLFDGKEILPKAATPKTAALTKMEYSDRNIIEIEYYDPEEWAELEQNALIDDDSDIFTAAREIMSMMKKRGIDPHKYTEKGSEHLEFETYDELITELNNYVGEDGKFTPLVKSVVLYLNKPEFEGLSIVDTPGLNDPIVSRTLRTKEFIEVCDVVFFLSQASCFLDKSDWTLLSAQLPEKGIKKLVLIASKYDSSVRDILRPKIADNPFGDDDNKADNIPDACDITAAKLRNIARKQVEQQIAEMQRRNVSESIIKVLDHCKKPMLVSSMAYNMAKKPKEEYSKEEMNVYNGLTAFSKNIKEDLERLGNVEKVRAIFDEAASQKESILMQKVNEFIPTAETEFKSLINTLKDKASKKLALLSGHDREMLVNQKRAVEAQINGIKSELMSAFGEWLAKLESQKVTTMGEIRTAMKEHGDVQERTGTETETHSYTVSDSKWYNPFSWGRSHTEYYTTTVSYTYLCVSDITDKLRNYVIECAGIIEDTFDKAVNTREMKRKLLNIITNNFDMGDENYDASFFRIIVENVINKIEFPIIKIETDSAIKGITANFSGEIRSSADKESLRSAFSSTLDNFFSILTGELEKNVKNFRKELENIQNSIQNQLLENINKEFSELADKFENREKEIENYKNYISALNSVNSTI